MKRHSKMCLSGLFLVFLFLASAARADTDTEIEAAIAQLRQQVGQTITRTDKADNELTAIRAYKWRVWKAWIQPWQANETAIRALTAEIEALKGIRAFNQNSRDLNNQMRALLAERAALERLRDGTVDDCAPPCADIHQLIRQYHGRVRRENELVAELADLNRASRRLDDQIEAQKARLAANKAARDKLLAVEKAKLTAERDRLAPMLKDPDHFILPSLTPGGLPRVLTKEDLALEVTLTLFEVGNSSDIDSPEFRAEVETLVRGLLQGSQTMRTRIKERIDFLDTQLAALDRRLTATGGGATASPDGPNCPARNPDLTGQVLTHRIPPGDDQNHLSCSYFAAPADGQRGGRIRSQVRYAAGKETGVSAYFTQDGEHHLDQIHNIHGPLTSGADCRYHSASAIAKYRLQGHDGSEMVVFCKADGTLGKCDFFTHDGRARRCSADCTDKCADLRTSIGWPAMR
ncbi:hypothetical protein [Mameliella sp.]|uniref:hypothetical protein n=1 Tax=Mameliella sp. TaxID=1924940 RepID=UPI003BA88961